MAASLLAAVHDAVAGAVEDIPEREEAGAQAPNSTKEGETMSRDNAPAGGENKSGIPQAEHEAAVKTARTEGEASGAKAATDRLVAALGAEGVKGDASRMSAALDLAVKSPGMSGADVAAFVSANVVGAEKPDPAAAYETGRLTAAGQAQPGAAKPATANGRSAWAEFRKKKNPAG